MDILLTQAIWLQIQSDHTLKAEVEIVYKKVRSHLDRYARTLGLTDEQLTLLQISDEYAELKPEFIKSIESRPRRKNTTVARHNQYTAEIQSRIKQMLLVLLGVHDNGEAGAAIFEKLPACIKEIFIHLPRLGATGRFRPNLDRSKLRLSKPSLDALQVLVHVAVQHDAQSPKELLVDHLKDLTHGTYFLIKDPSTWPSVLSIFPTLRGRVDLLGRKGAGPLSEVYVPPIMRQQIDRYAELAPTGAYSYPDLCEEANRRNVPLLPHEETTVSNNLRFLLMLLRDLAAEGFDLSNLEITDLIKIEPILSAEGSIIQNQYIDWFRERQRGATRLKVGGRDSNRFRATLLALKAVAAYNGLFEHYHKFKEAYEAHLDRKSQAVRKKNKKNAFPIAWIDKNLGLLKPRFNAVVKSKTFRTNIEDLWLCLFYVWMMTLRHAAIRQQGIRVCRKDWNIFFLKRLAVKFHWHEEEIKNDKDFQQTFKSSHVNTFAPLVEVLNKYRDHILPFLEKLAAQQGTDTGEQFFLRVSFRFEVRPFDETRAQTFSSQFKRMGWKFLDFTDVPEDMRVMFSALVIRGASSDWMHDDLAMGTHPTSRYLGDEDATTEKMYLQKHRIDATPILDMAEEQAAAIKARLMRERSSGGFAKVEVTLTPDVQALKEALNDSIARERERIEELAELKAKYKILSSGPEDSDE